MKNHFFILLAATVLTVSACGANRSVTGSVSPSAEKEISIVKGVWERPSVGEIKLFAVDKGRLNKVATSNLDSENKFYFAFKPTKETFYVIGTSDVGQIDNYMFYFKPGDELNFVINTDSYELVGANTPENIELTRWHDWILPLERSSIYMRNETGFSTYEDFFQMLEEKLAEGYTPVQTGNQVFDAKSDHFRDANLMYLAMNLIVTPRIKHPTSDDMTDYYKNMKLEKIADARLLEYPYGMDILRSYPLVYRLIHKDADFGVGLNGMIDFMFERIGDDQLKTEFLLMRANALKTYEDYLDFETRYGAYFVTPEQREIFKNVLRNIPISEASPAVNFTFSDTKGNMVSLSDFKGKVVYIDVWATWCGPCRGEIPHLKKLEGEFHDNSDIVFMSVSTDKGADRQKWLDMVESENLGGVQLFAGDQSSSDIIGPYKIKGIPRFILIGKDGNLINIDAPRPSSPEIRPLLEKALK